MCICPYRFNIQDVYQIFLRKCKCDSHSLSLDEKKSSVNEDWSSSDDDDVDGDQVFSTDAAMTRTVASIAKSYDGTINTTKPQSTGQKHVGRDTDARTASDSVKM